MKMGRREKENDYNRINTDDDYSVPLTGYLYKRASSGEWQRRYFEINGKYLIYYKTDAMDRVLAAVSIPQLGEIRVNGEMSDDKGVGVIFQIDLKNKTYYLRAEDMAEAEKWVKHLLFNRDGAVRSDELRKALNASNVKANKFSDKEQSIYNPQHKNSNPNEMEGDSDRSFGYSDDASMGTEELAPKAKSGRVPRRTSDTTWQKSHRFSCFRFW